MTIEVHSHIILAILLSFSGKFVPEMRQLSGASSQIQFSACKNRWNSWRRNTRMATSHGVADAPSEESYELRTLTGSQQIPQEIMSDRDNTGPSSYKTWTIYGRQLA